MRAGAAGAAALLCGVLATAPGAARGDAAGAVGADEPVITLPDFCPDTPRDGRACRTVITRAQFERLAEALEPGMPAARRLAVASAYARDLRMAAAAADRGLDATPAFAAELRYARLQLLAQDLEAALRADAARLSDHEVASYYAAHAGEFEVATMARLYVPHAPAGTPNAADIAALATLATELRERAASGEDMDELQRVAYRAAGATPADLDTRLTNVRRRTLPPSHEAVLDLAPGQVSAVLSDPGGAHFIYRMLAKRRLALEEADAEIRGALSRERYRDAMRPFEGGAVLNDAYFAPPVAATGARPERAPRGKRRPPAAPAADCAPDRCRTDP